MPEILVSMLKLNNLSRLEKNVPLVIEHLRNWNLEPETLLYRGLDGRNIQTILTSGHDAHYRNYTYAESYRQFTTLGPGRMGSQHPLEHAAYYSDPALALYRARLMRHMDGFEYEFMGHPVNSLVAVLKLKFADDVYAWEQPRL